MKTNCNLNCILIVVTLLTCVVCLVRSGLGQGTAHAAVDPITGLPPTRSPSAKFVGIYLANGDKGWELADLYETAADWLARKENAPLEVRTNVTVTIYLNTNALCLFTFNYTRPFGKSVWMVAMGNDGTVARCSKSKAAVDFPGQSPLRPPPPPPDEFSDKPPK